MPKIPSNVINNQHGRYLASCGLNLIHRGKVRDTYKPNETELLVVATDRLSIFDFVLPAIIPSKGECLTALTHFWLTNILRAYPNHLAENMTAILKKYQTWYPELPLTRCLLVKNLSGTLFPFELIFRHHIGGSVYKKYIENNGRVAEQDLLPNLPKWSKLEKPIFTPTTKAEEGHDLAVEPSQFFSETGEAGNNSVTMLLKMYSEAYAYAEKQGILILDTKFEAANGCVADEILTPDSSRFADEADWKKALSAGKEPTFYDKEVVRQWGKEIETPFGVRGINNLDPENDNHVNFVHSLFVPPSILLEAKDRYHKIIERLTGLTLEQYQKDAMGA
jgi:phosphoribosylaminoimidazole-succinocarboxamide synthase